MRNGHAGHATLSRGRGERALNGVAGLVLAAGGGRRYGGPKALVRHGDQLLVERAVAAVRDGGCAPVHVVVGAAGAEVRALGLDVTYVDNPAWKTGMGSSLRVGLASFAGLAVESVIVLLVDTPGVGPEAVERLVKVSSPAALAAATYDGRRGHPVLLGREHWAGVIETASGDEGARRYLAAHDVTEVDCTDLADPLDLDVPPPTAL